MKGIVMARGHPMVTAKHQTTIMLTKDKDVGPKGDCIIAVGADKAVSDFPADLKHAIRTGCKLVIIIRVGGIVEKINAYGHPSLSLNHPHDIVIRKSKFTCGRTLAIGADKAAVDLSKELVDALKNPMTELELEIKIRD